MFPKHLLHHHQLRHHIPPRHFHHHRHPSHHLPPKHLHKRFFLWSECPDPAFLLSQDNVNILKSDTALLNDVIIAKAQSMLTGQFPNVDSLQSVCFLEAVARFSVTLGSPVRERIQILNTAGHRVTASNINCSKRSVLRRQSRDTNRNIKRSVYCQYG